MSVFNRLLLLCVLVGVLFVPVNNPSCKQTPAVFDAAFTERFRRDGDGLTGADGTYSILLPDGRTLWIFQDSFLGTVEPDGSRSYENRLIRNSAVVQDGATMTTLHSGTPDAPETWLVLPDDSDLWYWPMDGTVVGDRLYIFLQTVRQEEPGGWGFRYGGRDDLAILTLPDLTLERIITINTNPDIIYGSAILEADGYIYIYGIEDHPTVKYAYVARTTDILGAWEFFDGRGWTADEGAVALIEDDVSSQFSVIAWKGAYWLITQRTGFSREIVAYQAEQPTGPWNDPILLYCTPESHGDLFTYNAVTHPQFSEGDLLLISYNVNSFEFQDVFDDADNYRPRFVRVALP